jgi:hypothetical protein
VHVRAAPAVAGDPSLDRIVDEFNATLASWYPGFDPVAAFGGSPLAQAFPVLPSVATRTMRFSSEAAIRSFVKDIDYALPGHPEVCEQSRT